MNNFSIKEVSNRDLLIFKNNMPYTTYKGNNIIISEVKRKKELIEKINEESNDNKSKFIELLFFSNDIDKEKRKLITTKILNYIDTDLICYRKDIGTELEKKQKQKWDPYLNFCLKKHSLDFSINYTVIPKIQKKNTHDRILRIVNKMDKYHITAFYFLVEMTSSIILSLNILYNKISIKEAWIACNLEYEYNQIKWGKDKEFNEELLIKKKIFTNIVNYIKFF